MTPEDAGPALPGRDAPVPGVGVADSISDHVVVAGYGRWGRGVTRVFEEAGIPQVVATLSPARAVDAYDQGLPVLLGDPVRSRTLLQVGVQRARAVVIPDDGAERARQVVRVVRTLAPDVTVIVRTRYASDIAGLEADGATWVVTEEVEASDARDQGPQDVRCRTRRRGAARPRRAPVLSQAWRRSAGRRAPAAAQRRRHVGRRPRRRRAGRLPARPPD